MAYRMPDLSDLGSVVAEQLDEVEAGIAEGDLHRLRKATKRLRALLVLVSPELRRSRARKDRRLLRDLARLAAGGRDAQVVGQRFDQLAPHLDAPVEEVAAVRRALREEAEQAAAAWDADEARQLLARLRRRAARWSVSSEGVERAVRKTFGRCRKLMRAAEHQRDADVLHEWRKQAKYHWHHVELLGREDRAIVVHRVADRLGDDHDLAVLVAAAPGLPGLVELAASRRRELQAEAFDLGEALFGARPRLAARQLVAGLPVP